jgi:hypothetical protein
MNNKTYRLSQLKQLFQPRALAVAATAMLAHAGVVWVAENCLSVSTSNAAGKQSLETPEPLIFV